MVQRGCIRLLLKVFDHGYNIEDNSKAFKGFVFRHVKDIYKLIDMHDLTRNRLAVDSVVGHRSGPLFLETSSRPTLH